MNPKDLLLESYDPHKKERGGMTTGHIPAGVKATHTPTGCVVACTTHRSQHRNKDTALALLELMLEEPPR